MPQGQNRPGRLVSSTRPCQDVGPKKEPCPRKPTALFRHRSVSRRLCFAHGDKWLARCVNVVK